MLVILFWLIGVPTAIALCRTPMNASEFLQKQRFTGFFYYEFAIMLVVITITII